MMPDLSDARFVLRALSNILSRLINDHNSSITVSIPLFLYIKTCFSLQRYENIHYKNNNIMPKSITDTFYNGKMAKFNQLFFLYICLSFFFYKLFFFLSFETDQKTTKITSKTPQNTPKNNIIRVISPL